MPNSAKQNAANMGGAPFTKLAGGVNVKSKVVQCGVHSTSRLRREIEANGLALRDTSGQTQCAALLRVLRYLGDRGVNTPEAVALGFFRAATRVHELEADGWAIDSPRESVLGADGLVHVGVARYILRGRKEDFVDPQGSLLLEVTA